MLIWPTKLWLYPLMDSRIWCTSSRKVRWFSDPGCSCVASKALWWTTISAVAREAYRRSGTPLKWEHIVYSLQELGLAVHVGGRSALELLGYAYYLPIQGIKRIHLAALMIKYNLGVSTKQTYELKSIDTDYFYEDNQ